MYSIQLKFYPLLEGVPYNALSSGIRNGRSLSDIFVRNRAPHEPFEFTLSRTKNIKIKRQAKEKAHFHALAINPNANESKPHDMLTS